MPVRGFDIFYGIFHLPGEEVVHDRLESAFSLLEGQTAHGDPGNGGSLGKFIAVRDTGIDFKGRLDAVVKHTATSRTAANTEMNRIPLFVLLFIKIPRIRFSAVFLLFCRDIPKTG